MLRRLLRRILFWALQEPQAKGAAAAQAPASPPPPPLANYCPTLADKYVGKEHVDEFSGNGVRFVVEEVVAKKNGVAVLVGKMDGGEPWQCCIKA